MIQIRYLEDVRLQVIFRLRGLAPDVVGGAKGLQFSLGSRLPLIRQGVNSHVLQLVPLEGGVTHAARDQVSPEHLKQKMAHMTVGRTRHPRNASRNSRYHKRDSVGGVAG